jgi:hypothetical protein
LTDVADTNVDVTIRRGDTSNDVLIGNIASQTPADTAAATGLTLGSNAIVFDASGSDAVGDMVEVICYSATADVTSFVARGIAAT